MRLIHVLLVTMFLTLPLSAQDLPSFPAPNFNDRSPEGIFDLLVHVDGEAFFYVQNNQLRYLLLSGAAPRDGGSNYSQSLPRAVFGQFNMEKKAGRGNVDLVEEPTARNAYTAVVRITDKQSGEAFYHVRLNWIWNPADPSRAPGGRFTERLNSRTNDPGDYDRSRDGAFEFRGRVDDVLVLYIRSDQVRSELISGRSLRGDKFRFSQPLPSGRLRDIQLLDIEGRGQVELVEKPWEGNRFTAVVRITDRRGGDAPYSFKLAWRR